MRYLYIDPGTGSMLFTILIGVLGAVFYSLRMLFVKLRYKVGTKNESKSLDEIPFVIYSDDKRYWNIFEPICREMNKRGKEVVYLTASADDKVFDCGYENVKAECIGKTNKSFARLNFLNATILLSTTPGLDVYQWKRSKGVRYYVHITHTAGDVTLYRMFGIDYFDAVLLSGEHQVQKIRKLEEMRSLNNKELVKVGIPYMDEMVARLKNEGPAPEHPTTVLLAPSWGESAIFSVYGGKIIDALLKTGYHIIIRPHPQSFESETEMIEDLMKKYPDSDKLEWNRDTDNFNVLRRSDILVSDFSGVIYDFTLVYDKPVIYTNPDFKINIYDAWWLNDPIWTIGVLPRLGRQLNEENISDIKSLIDTCLTDTKYAEGRAEARAETWEHMGEGAVRATDYLLNKYDELVNKEEVK